MARRHTCPIIGIPAIDAMGLPGKRLESYLDGIKAIILMGDRVSLYYSIMPSARPESSFYNSPFILYGLHIFGDPVSSPKENLNIRVPITDSKGA
jgi:hypothetical protein